MCSPLAWRANFVLALPAVRQLVSRGPGGRRALPPAARRGGAGQRAHLRACSWTGPRPSGSSPSAPGGCSGSCWWSSSSPLPGPPPPCAPARDLGRTLAPRRHGRPPHHDPAGPVLRPGRLPRGPVGAGAARGAHPRPRRPRAGGQRRVPLRGARPSHRAAPPPRNRHRGVGVRRAALHGRRPALLPSRRARARLGPAPHRGRRARSGW